MKLGRNTILVVCFSLFACLVALTWSPRKVSALVAGDSSGDVSADAASGAPAVMAVLAGMEQRAYQLINGERRTRGLSELSWDTDLCRMARLHSEKMAQRHFFAHTGPDGVTMLDRARLAGIHGWKALGENIAYNMGYSDPAAFAVERWIGSAKHHQNMLRPAFTHTGVGVAYAPDGSYYFTQVFAAK